MEGLIKARGTIKAKVTCFKTYLGKVKASSLNVMQALDEIKRLEITERLKHIRKAYDKFDEIQMQIEESSDAVEVNVEYRVIFEEEYYHAVAQAEELLARGNVIQETQNAAPPVNDQNNVPGPSVARQTNQNIIFKTPGVRLPTIELPKFKGELAEWLGFKDTFESLIHKNESIDAIQKFHYLRASLEGNAAQIIKSLEFSAINYTVAWKTICDRFDNKRLLTHNHIKAICTITHMKEESAARIRDIIDTLNKHMRALNALGQSTDHWDALLIYLISEKIDNVTMREWERQCAEIELPTLEQFKDFLTQRANLLETLELNNKGMNNSKYKMERSNSKTFLVQRQGCAVCKEAHRIQQCPKFLELTPQRRAEHLKSAKLCLNCMKPGHFIKECRSGSCKKCSAKHNTLIHYDKHSSSQATDNKDNTSTAVLCSQNQAMDSHVLLSTALVIVKDRQGKSHKARAILDPGSQSSLISTSLYEELQLEKSETHINLEAINNVSCQIKHRCQIKVASHHTNYEFTVSCLIIPQITGLLPNCKIDKQSLQIPPNIRLADPSFHIPAKIDILLGADCFWNLLCIGQFKVNKELTMQKTKLGWIAAGTLAIPETNSVRCNFSNCTDINEQMARFWELEECSDQGKKFSQEEKECESHFARTHTRDANGRFVVEIPLKKNPSVLGESQPKALQRLISLETRLDKKPTIKTQYASFLQEYKDLNHMRELSNSQTDKIAYYLPHHCVIRSESITTKIRVVFDASASTDNGVSLNDIQRVGPTLQEDLFTILIRFRTHTYVISADIEKMFRQILVTPEQRSLQRILWRSDKKDPVKVFELNTLTYGTASAPYLATRCLVELANENEQQSPEIARIIRKDFYVDDLLTGTNTREEAINVIHKIKGILESAGFRLHKWISNEAAILKDIPEEDQNPNYVNLVNGGQTKTLGLVWQAHHDLLIYTLKDLPEVKVTKRRILSEMTQIFDPLGLLSPYIITAKILLQKLWLHKLTWDESLPHDLHSTWTSFRRQLSNLRQIRIPRRAVCKDCKEMQLHGFADASQNAYGACIYIRSLDAMGNITVHLLCSKTRVAPLKIQTIPRLELCAALILARLTKKVIESFNLSFEKIVYWSDSTIVLSWLQTEPSRLQVFVSNRIAEIQRLTDHNSWRHVPTQDNPADLLSRGMPLDQLAQSKLWWNGPHYLLKKDAAWPSMPELGASTSELRRTVCTLTQVDQSIFEITTNLGRLIRIIAYCKRFINNCKGDDRHNSTTLTAAELTDALYVLAKSAQTQSFSTEIQILKDKGLITKGKLAPLNPFIDEKGFIRVGGRLKNSELEIDKKHPIVLSNNHPFTKLLFIYEHLKLLHAGPQLLLYSIRERFWPIGGRNLARKTVHNCIRCFRHNPQQSQIPTGELPSLRVTLSAPFHATGVDYAGPFLIKDRKGRGSKTSKAFVCLFVCFATKAVHLELVSDLTSEAFIAALRRFSSRRGKPAHMHSDNGTNFVGANRELKNLAQLVDEANFKDNVSNEFGITWHFIPAHSPHFGGLWEAGVKSTKYHLKRVAGNSVLTFEEFYTFLTQIEALLNSRPLTPMSSDPNDISPITPAHFLIGRTLTSVADPTLMHLPESKLSRWQLIQRLQQHFWQRWSKEYISELQVRTKRTNSIRPITEGMMVVIKEDNLPPLKWKLGRIISTHPGKDNITRVATVKTATGSIKITTAKLCPLPNEDCIN